MGKYVLLLLSIFAIIKADNEIYYYDSWQSGLLHSFQEKEINTTMYQTVLDSDYNSEKISQFCKEYKESKQSCIWKYIYKDNKYLFFSKCIDSAKSKKYELGLQDLSVELIPELKDSKKIITIKKLSCRSLCCYTRLYYLLTIWH